MAYLKAKAVLVLITILAVSPAHSEQVTIPDTAAGRVLAAWLEAFNSGDQARFGIYQQKYEPAPELPPDAVMAFRARTGGFDLVGIHKSEPLHIEYLVQERASDTRALGRFDVTPSDPPKVTTSGLRAIPPGAAIIGFEIDAVDRDRVIAGSIAKLKENYVFPETAKKMEQALRGHQKRGEYDTVTDGEKFAALLTTHLQEVSHDRHLRVNFSAVRYPDDLVTPGPQQVAENRRMTERTNCGFEKVELLAGNVGYVKFNMFADPILCGQTAIAAMNFLANVDAIIFDLRDNGGGDPAMVALISTYLFDQPTHLNDIWTRKTGATQQYWTLPVVPGKRLAAAAGFRADIVPDVLRRRGVQLQPQEPQTSNHRWRDDGRGRTPSAGRTHRRSLRDWSAVRARDQPDHIDELGRYWSRARRKGCRGRRADDCTKAGDRRAGEEEICSKRRHELSQLLAV